MAEESNNIFDEARRQGSNKKKPKAAAPKKERESEPERQKKTDPEIEAIFTRIQEMQNDLEEKIDYIKSQAVPFFKDFEKVLENPELINIPGSDEVAKKKKELENEVVNVIGYEFSSKLQKKREKRKSKQSGKAQKLKGKKKNWLSMD